MKKLLILVMAIILAATPILAGCGCDDDSTSGDKPTPEGSPPTEGATSAETQEYDGPIVEITIGEIVDLTSVSANAMAKIDYCFKDLVKYYNDNNLIPGVKLKADTYDNQYDPSKDVPGYNWLKGRGSDVFFSPVSASAVTLRPYLKRDEMLLFTVAPNPESFEPCEWVFAAGQTSVTFEIYNLLAWIAENEWDYEADGPAKLGAVFWSESYGDACVAACKDYAEANPDQYEWINGYLTDFKFTWPGEIEGLKGCDYIMPPVPMNTFVSQFRDAGHTTNWIGTDAHIAFLDMIEKQGLFEELDGMLLTKPAQWWTDVKDDSVTIAEATEGIEPSTIATAKEMLQTYRPSQADSIIESGIGYLAVQQLYVMFELIKDTCAAVGPENFSSKAMYDFAHNGWEITVDGCPHSYSANKCTSSDGLYIYKVDASAEEFMDKIYRADPDWSPVQTTP